MILAIQIANSEDVGRPCSPATGRLDWLAESSRLFASRGQSLFPFCWHGLSEIRVGFLICGVQEIVGFLPCGDF